jgi:hypothetical protein
MLVCELRADHQPVTLALRATRDSVGADGGFRIVFRPVASKP